MFVFNIFLRNIIQNQLYTNYKSKITTKPPSYPYNERNLGYLFPSIVSVTYYLILYWQKAVHSFQKTPATQCKKILWVLLHTHCRN